MPNIANAFKAEIGRIARKEIRSETAALKKAASQYRAQIAALRKQLDALERQMKRIAKGLPASTSARDDQSTERLRFRAAGFAKHRQRLGISAREMGLLLGASPLSVYKWEQGQARPRAKQLEAIASVRKMGKREATRRLEELAA